MNFYQSSIMVWSMALVFFTLGFSVFAAPDDCLENQSQPLKTIESGFSEIFPDHISDAVLSSLVYLKNATHHLCDGAIFDSRQAIFTEKCLDGDVLKDNKNGFSGYSVVLRSPITQNVKIYSIENVYYEIGSKLYGRYEPFVILILTEDVLDVEWITWPSIKIDEGSAAVVGGWDENEKFKMYYVPHTETHIFIYTPPAANGFRGSYIFRNHQLIGLFRRSLRNQTYNGINIPDNRSLYFHVCCGIDIAEKPIDYIKQLSKKVLCGLYGGDDYEPGFFLGDSPLHSDADSE